MLDRTDRKPVNQVVSETSADRNAPTAASAASESQALNHKQLQIIQWLKEVRFRRQLFGGVNEQDVWRKIEELNEMYEAALKEERIRYDVLLEKQSKGSESSIESSYPLKDRTAYD